MNENLILSKWIHEAYNVLNNILGLLLILQFPS